MQFDVLSVNARLKLHQLTRQRIQYRFAVANGPTLNSESEVQRILSVGPFATAKRY